MEKEFIPYEQALALKELGFDEPCFGFYTQNAYGSTPKQKVQYWREPIGGNDDYVFVLAPLYQQAFRFFREEHKLSCSIELTDNSRHYYFDFTIYDSKNREYNDEDCFDFCRRTYDNRKYSKHEEAELECLKKLIEIVKEK